MHPPVNKHIAGEHRGSPLQPSLKHSDKLYIKTVSQYDTVFMLIFYLFKLSSHIISTDISAGETPDILEA